MKETLSWPILDTFPVHLAQVPELQQYRAQKYGIQFSFFYHCHLSQQHPTVWITAALPERPKPSGKVAQEESGSLSPVLALVFRCLISTVSILEIPLCDDVIWERPRKKGSKVLVFIWRVATIMSSQFHLLDEGIKRTLIVF